MLNRAILFVFLGLSLFTSCKKDEQIVDRQTAKVTIRWDRDSDQAQQIMRRKFGG